MKPPDENPRLKLVTEWLFKAGQDIRSAETLLSQDPPLLFPSCFHSQQAAEKYLKALLTLWGVEVPKTHDLGKLLQLIESHNARLAGGLVDAVILNAYAVDARYPGEHPEASEEEARQALGLAYQIRAAIMPLLPSR
jgi:HEPN domain-containing protein